MSFEVVVPASGKKHPLRGHVRVPGETWPLCGLRTPVAGFRRVRPGERPDEVCEDCKARGDAILEAARAAMVPAE